MQQWEIDNTIARRLLGSPAERTFYEWKKGKVGRIPEDTLRRIGYVAGIWKGLQIIYSQPDLADSWVKRPNAFFGSQTPLQRMAAGDVTDLAAGRLLHRRCPCPLVLRSRSPRSSGPRHGASLPHAFHPSTCSSAFHPTLRVWDALIELEEITNPRVRDQVGQIRLVPPERRVSGVNASWVMAAFTHVNPKGSRFSDGTYGVYYAANNLETAIAETIHHFAAFARDADDPARREDMRVLVGSISSMFHDVGLLRPEEHCTAVLDPNDYHAGQALARSLREQHSNGVVYPSVRPPAWTLRCGFSGRMLSASHARNAISNTNGTARR